MCIVQYKSFILEESKVYVQSMLKNSLKKQTNRKILLA